MRKKYLWKIELLALKRKIWNYIEEIIEMNLFKYFRILKINLTQKISKFIFNQRNSNFEVFISQINQS